MIHILTVATALNEVLKRANGRRAKHARYSSFIGAYNRCSPTCSIETIWNRVFSPCVEFTDEDRACIRLSVRKSEIHYQCFYQAPLKGTRQDNADPWASKENQPVEKIHVRLTVQAMLQGRQDLFFPHLLFIIIIPIHSNVLLSYWSLLFLNDTLVFLVHF